MEGSLLCDGHGGAQAHYGGGRRREEEGDEGSDDNEGGGRSRRHKLGKVCGVVWAVMRVVVSKIELWEMQESEIVMQPKTQ